ncbi:MAG: serine hydrolase domain-containing protein, partial [Bacteroidales bacterium]
MNGKIVISLLLIIFITLLGYTLQPQTQANISLSFEEEEVELNRKAEISPFLDDFTAYMDNLLHERNIVGAAYAIVYKGQVVVLQSHGVKNAQTQDSVNSHTVFRLASLSKGFGGVMASKLHQSGVVNLDSTVVSYFPEFTLKRKVNQQTLTLRNVLSHSSGMVAHSFDPWIESNKSFNEIFNNFDVANITHKPGERYSYQNALYCLFDTVAYTATGKPVQQLMKDSLFAPLGMTDASMTFEEFVGHENFAYPHARGRWGHYYPTRLNSRYYSVASAAGVNASIYDMSKWLQALLGYKRSVVPHTVLHEIAEPQVKTPISYRARRNWNHITKKEYGLGWRLITAQGEQFVHHGGYVDGYRNEIAFCPNKKIG